MSNIKNVGLSLPPEAILRGYLYLIHEAFLFMRSTSRFGNEQAALVADLGDALHNITELISNYEGGWLSDEVFRKVYLRAFDTQWAGHPKGGIKLEGLLEEFEERYRANQAANEPKL